MFLIKNVSKKAVKHSQSFESVRNASFKFCKEKHSITMCSSFFFDSESWEKTSGIKYVK